MDDRPITKHIPDFESAYIYQRYKEIHDFIHVILFNQDISVKEELAIKWFELV